MCRSRNKLKLDPTLNPKRQLRGEIRRYEKEENKDKIKKVKKITKYTEIEGRRKGKEKVTSMKDVLDKRC